MSEAAQIPQDEVLLHVQKHWASIQPNSPVYGFFFPHIQLVSATRDAAGNCMGRIVARLPLESQHINSKKILHGSVSATLVDWAGGMAIAAATGRDRTGVSVDIHVSYVGAAREGDILEVEGWVTKAGRNLAYTQVEIRKVAGGGEGEGEGAKGAKGPVVATGSHTKYLNI